MKTNHQFKAGETVVLTRSNGKREFKVIRAVSKTELDIGTNGFVYRFDPRTGQSLSRKASLETIALATPALIAEIQAEQATIKAADEAAAARIAADPRTPYIRKLSGDWHEWNKLTLEQLKQVDQWLTQPQPTEAA